MNYFCDVNLQSRKDEESRIFLVISDNDSDKQPELTKEILTSNNQFKEFWSKYKAKVVIADYTMYATENAVYASSQDDIFIELIESGNVELIGRGEIMVDSANTKIKGKSSLKKKGKLLRS